jgi:hypothetical protein
MISAATIRFHTRVTLTTGLTVMALDAPVKSLPHVITIFVVLVLPMTQK